MVFVYIKSKKYDIIYALTKETQLFCDEMIIHKVCLC